ncbi:MAG: filamentous hemagglutinin N-terminal domain-containing protein, partial [Burkholderiaceae bacterium]|nr:filamentous hemagglutinin N-terminal domain-containing protein [Burkholderiaceae bacterium]
MPVLKPAACLVALALAVMASPASRAQVLPTAPQVVGGAASVSQNGNQQTVNQYTDRAIINWGSFSIGAGAGVTFVQPGANSVVLNRVTGGDPSSILGSMSANGQVFLVNPNGVFFGGDSRVDTGALVATTLSIANDDFMAGRYSFTRGAGAAGAVENAGIITIREGGFALLAADRVVNTATGQINAPGGVVQLASADRVTIDTRPDGLVSFSVSGDSVREVASVHNAGVISADGGQIALSARGARELTGMVVNNTGLLRATSIEEREGAVILSASAGETLSSGQIDVSGVRGGAIEVSNDSGTAAVSGQLAARGDTGAGGRIVVAGQQTGLMAGAQVDASGATGGTVRVGGEYRGAAVQTAGGSQIVSDITYVAGSASIRADGTAGQGGSVVVWADGVTRYDGSISARGAGGASGGDAEVSGKETLVFSGTADLRSDTGDSGTLLLDPRKITITNQAAGQGTNDGDLTNPFQLTASAAGDSRISKGTLEGIGATANVVLEARDRIFMEDLGGGTLDMKQNATGSFTMRTTVSDTVGGEQGGIFFQNTYDTISTRGGDITLTAGGAGVINVGGLKSNGGDITLNAGGSIATSGSEINAGGGNIGFTSSAGGITTGNQIYAGGGDITLAATGGQLLVNNIVYSNDGAV